MKKTETNELDKIEARIAWLEEMITRKKRIVGDWYLTACKKNIINSAGVSPVDAVIREIGIAQDLLDSCIKEKMVYDNKLLEELMEASVKKEVTTRGVFDFFDNHGVLIPTKEVIEKLRKIYKLPSIK